MFSRDARTSPAKGGAKFSFIGPEVTVTGDIETSGQLHIDGTVAGDVRCGTLTQGESGAVHGNIVAGEARLAGLVDGAVEAGSLSLEPSARVTGDVLYEDISIARGAQIDGRLRRRKGEADGSAAARGEAPRPAKLAAGGGGGLFAVPPAEAAE